MLQVYDNILATSSYLASNGFTLADQFRLSTGWDAPVNELARKSFGKYANVMRWLETISSGEALKAVNIPRPMGAKIVDFLTEAPKKVAMMEESCSPCLDRGNSASSQELE